MGCGATRADLTANDAVRWMYELFIWLSGGACHIDTWDARARR